MNVEKGKIINWKIHRYTFLCQTFGIVSENTEIGYIEADEYIINGYFLGHAKFLG